MSPQNLNAAAAAPIISLDESDFGPPPLQLDDGGVAEGGDVVIVDEGGSQNRGVLFVLVFLIVAVGAIHFSGESEDPLENLVTFFRKLFASEEVVVPVTQVPRSRTVPEVPPTLEFDPTMIPNPYWILPNSLEKGPRKSETLSVEDVARFQNGLRHKFTYQRYKAVKELRANARLGSAALLARGIEQPKFWTRMEAGLGLIEQGYALDTVGVERIIGDARSSLIVNYFRRFMDGASKSEIYFVKQAIRVVDGRARLAILKILAPQREKNALYFAAAQYDPSPYVRDWLQETFNGQPVSEGDAAAYEKLVVNDFIKRSQSAPLKENAQQAPVVAPAIPVNVEELPPLDDNAVEDVTIFKDEGTQEEGVLDTEEAFPDPQNNDDGFKDIVKE